MKLLLILTSSILLLSSCQQYRYDVTYEKCNGMTGSLSYIAEDSILYGDLFIYPQGIVNLYYPNGKISNVCDFSYIRTPITK